MIYFAIIIPILATISSILGYRLTGKKELLRLDIVQFFYAFVLSPFLFVWGKSLLFLILRNDLGVKLNNTEMFIIDTTFSVLVLYIFAFVVLHSVTKSINVNVGKDPLYDIFHHTEYFHLWLSHLVMFIGGMSLFTLIALANVMVPLPIYLSRVSFLSIYFSGFFFGTLIFLGVWLSNPKQQQANFMRVMKLSFGLLFLVHALAYFIWQIPFHSERLVYWFSSAFFSSLVMNSFFTYKSERVHILFERLANKFKHNKWDFRVQVFKKK